MLLKRQLGAFIWLTALLPFGSLFGLLGLILFHNYQALQALERVENRQIAIINQDKERINRPQKELIDWETKQVKNSLVLQRLTLVVGTGLQSVIVLIYIFSVVFKATQNFKNAATEVTAGVSEITATLEEQERLLAQQAASVHQTTTTIDQLGASARQSAEQAAAAAVGAKQALTLASGGTDSVNHTLEGMARLKTDVDAIAQKIIQLSEQTSQIGNISIVVSDLANQTNMLALNAAVEAVRAGENGKGFAVVAAEIRKLADESKKAALKINNLVGDIQSAIGSTVMATDAGTKNVDASVKIAQETTATFQGVVDAVNNISVSTQQISLTAQQQAIAIQQVIDAMNHLNQAAAETSSSISQVKVGTQQLNAAAEYLKSIA